MATTSPHPILMLFRPQRRTGRSFRTTPQQQVCGSIWPLGWIAAALGTPLIPICVLLVALSAFGEGNDTQTLFSKSEKTMLNGRLTLSDGTYVPGAEVRITCGKHHVSVTTTEVGYFAWPVFAQGKCRITIPGAGFDSTMIIHANSKPLLRIPPKIHMVIKWIGWSGVGTTVLDETIPQPVRVAWFPVEIKNGKFGYAKENFHVPLSTLKPKTRYRLALDPQVLVPIRLIGQQERFRLPFKLQEPRLPRGANVILKKIADLYEQGRKAQKNGEIEKAKLHYEQAIRVGRKNKDGPQREFVAEYNGAAAFQSADMCADAILRRWPMSNWERSKTTVSRLQFCGKEMQRVSRFAKGKWSLAAYLRVAAVMEYMGDLDTRRCNFLPVHRKWVNVAMRPGAYHLIMGTPSFRARRKELLQELKPLYARCENAARKAKMPKTVRAINKRRALLGRLWHIGPKLWVEEIVRRPWMPLKFRGKPRPGAAADVFVRKEADLVMPFGVTLGSRHFAVVGLCDQQIFKWRDLQFPIDEGCESIRLGASTILTQVCEQTAHRDRFLDAGPELTWALSAKPPELFVLNRKGHILFRTPAKSTSALSKGLDFLERTWPDLQKASPQCKAAIAMAKKSAAQR